MPYIKQDAREKFSAALDRVPVIETAGELNYLFSMLAQRYTEDHAPSYSTFNDVMGAFTGANLEFYRRVVAPYEDVKIRTNGDI